MKILSILSLLAVIGFCGCASTSVTMYNDTNYPPTKSIYVYPDSAPAPGDYTVIGIVEMHGGGIDRQALLDSLKTRAMTVGANALINVQLNIYGDIIEGVMYQGPPAAKATMIRLKQLPSQSP